MKRDTAAIKDRKETITDVVTGNWSVASGILAFGMASIRYDSDSNRFMRLNPLRWFECR
jgi:hypothetical protein